MRVISVRNHLNSSHSIADSKQLEFKQNEQFARAMFSIDPNFFERNRLTNHSSLFQIDALTVLLLKLAENTEPHLD
jgi:hypothetical protein